MGCATSKTAVQASQPATPAPATPATAGDAEPAQARIVDQQTLLGSQQAKDKKQSPAHHVQVSIIGVTGLRIGDVLSCKSDVLVEVQIGGKVESKVSTSVALANVAADDVSSAHVRTTAGMDFEFETELKGYAAGDTIEFVAKDSDPLKEDILGRATLTQEQVDQGFDGQLELIHAGYGYVPAYLKVKVCREGILEETEEKAGDALLEATAGVSEVVGEHLSTESARGSEIQESRQQVAHEIKEAAAEVINDVANSKVKGTAIVEEATLEIRSSIQEAYVEIEDSKSAMCCTCGNWS